MKPLQIGAFEAKTHFSELLEKVHRGEVFVITRHGKPLAEIRPLPQVTKKPTFGRAAGKFWMSDDFDAPLEEFKDYM